MQSNPVFFYLKPHLTYLLHSAIVYVCCAIPLQLFSQAATITNASVKTRQLPDPSALQTAAAVHEAISISETAGKALSADAGNELAALKAGETDYNKAQTLSTIYLTALNNFAKNDVAKYNDEMKNYTASGSKYQETLKAYNAAVLKNNLLPAKARKLPVVDTLNKHKAQLDAWGVKLGKWQTTLEAAKAKLDITNQNLQMQKQKYDVANQQAVAKLKASKKKLTALLGQITVCVNYDSKYRQLLTDKFKELNTIDTSYFITTGYKDLMVNINTEMEKIKMLPGITADIVK